MSTLARYASLLVALVATHLSGASALAQPAGGYWVVQQDGTVLRSGDMPRFYRVMDLPAGTVVESLGSSEGWTMVAYPAGSTAYVEADRAEKVDANTVRLTKPSNLLAPSALLGASGSWCPLFADPLPVGTSLKLVEEVSGIGGTVSKYLIEAPRPPASPTPARGFVRTESLRQATPAEAQSLTRANTTGQPATRETIPTATQPDDEPADTQPQPVPSGDEEVDTSLLSPIVTGPLDPVEESPRQPTAQPGETTLANNGGNEPPVPANHQEMVALSINELNAAFDELRTLPRAEADEALEEMLAECRRTREKLSAEPELQRAIDQRIAWIELRMKLRDQRLALDAAIKDADAEREALAGRVSEWRQGRAFTVIGRVFRSTLYDGERLPLMYRVESVDGPGFGRTTAYLRPTDDFDLSKLVGAVVGVVGNPRYDDALGVRIISVDSIETLDGP